MDLVKSFCLSVDLLSSTKDAWQSMNKENPAQEGDLMELVCIGIEFPFRPRCQTDKKEEEGANHALSSGGC